MDTGFNSCVAPHAGAWIETSIYADDYDFKRTKWGVSQKEVLASKKANP